MSSQAMLMVKMFFCFPGPFLVIQNDTIPPVMERMTCISFSAQFVVRLLEKIEMDSVL